MNLPKISKPATETETKPKQRLTVRHAPRVIRGPFGNLIPNPRFNRLISKHAAARIDQKRPKRRNRRKP